MRLLGLSLAALAAVGAFTVITVPAPKVASASATEQAASGAQAAVNSDPARIVLSDSDARLAARAQLLPAHARTLLSEGEMRHGNFAWNDKGVPKGKVTVWVDLRRQLVSVFRGGHEIGTAVILYGAPGLETPRGTFPILRKVADYHSRSYDAPMPHSLFITNDGVALHGSDVRYGRATHGCIGLPPEFARLLFDEAKVGDKVTVVISDAGATAKLAEALSVTRH